MRVHEGATSTLSAAWWRRRARLVLVLVVIALVAVGTMIESSQPSSTGTDAASVPAGLFVSSQSPADVLALGKQLGVTPTIMTVYADGSCYCSYADPPSTSMTLMLGVGALTTSEATSIGNSLVAAGQSDAIIRIMWEQNQDVDGWFPDWNQLALSAARYISTFQSIVTTMRAVPGEAFKFMWNPNGGTGNEASGRTWEDTWPGSSYVNYVGVDQYDYSGYASNIQAVISFAQSQGLQAAIPEWGLDGSDDPSYINGVATLIGDAPADIALQAYFSYDGGSGGTNSDITEFPKSEAAFTTDFGGLPSTIPPTTTTTATPPTTIPPTTTTTATPPTTIPPTTTTTATPPTTIPPTTTTTATPPTTIPPTTTTTATPPTTIPPTTTTTATPPTTIPPVQATITTVTLAPATGSDAQVLTATVSPAPDGGTVAFSVDGQAVAGSEPVGADGTAETSLALADGPHAVIATYSGTADFGSSTVQTTLSVGQNPTTLVASPPALTGGGQQYLLTATLTSAGHPIPGALVSFTALGSPLCQSMTDTTGSATCAIATGPSETLSLTTTGYTAVFSGDPKHLPASDHSPIFGGDHWKGRGTRPGTTWKQRPVPPSWSPGGSSRTHPDQDAGTSPPAQGHEPRTGDSRFSRSAASVIVDTSTDKAQGSDGVIWLLGALGMVLVAGMGGRRYRIRSGQAGISARRR